MAEPNKIKVESTIMTEPIKKIRESANLLPKNFLTDARLKDFLKQVEQQANELQQHITKVNDLTKDNKTLTSRVSDLDAKLSQREKDLRAKETELETTKKKLNEKEKALLKLEDDLETTKKKLNEKENALLKLEGDLTKATVEYEIKEKRFERERESLVLEVAKYLEDIENYKKYENEKMVTYSTGDISDFLNKTINDFNSNSKSDSNEAKYIINNMDVDLKVRICNDIENKDKNDKENKDKCPIKFMAPSIRETTEDSMSSIKISIQAVPK